MTTHKSKFQDCEEDNGHFLSQQEPYIIRNTIQEPLLHQNDKNLSQKSLGQSSFFDKFNRNQLVGGQMMLNIGFIIALAFLLYNNHQEKSCQNEGATSCNMCPTEFQDGTNQNLLAQSQKIQALTQQQKLFQENLSSKDQLIFGIQAKTVSDIQMLRNDIIPLKESSQQCSSSCQAANDSLSQMSTLSKEIQIVKAEQNTKIIESQSKIIEIQTQQGIQQGEISLIKSEVVTVSRDFKFLRDDMAPLDQSIKQCTSCCQKIDDTRSQTSTLQTEIQTVKTEMAQTDSRVAQVQTQQGTQQGQIEQIKSEVTEMKSTSGIKDKTLTQHEARIQKLESDQKAMVKTQEDVFNQQQTKVKQLESDQQYLKQIQSQTDSRVDVLTKTTTAQQAQITTLQNDYTNMDKRLKKVEEDEDQTKQCLEKNNKTLNCKKQEPKPTPPYTQKPQPFGIGAYYSGTGFQRLTPMFMYNIEYEQITTIKFNPLQLSDFGIPESEKPQKWRSDYQFKRVITQCTFKDYSTCPPVFGGYQDTKQIDQALMRAGFKEELTLPVMNFSYELYFTCDAGTKCGKIYVDGQVLSSQKKEENRNSTSNAQQNMLF